jgi:hypothetical protein
MRRTFLMSVTVAALVACQSNEPSEGSRQSETALREQVQHIARDFPTWGALDTKLRRAPTDCRMPPAGSQGSLALSDAESGPHGTKLYRLFARDPAAYRGLESGAAQVGQVLVKQAFVAEPFTMPGPGEVPRDVVATPQGLVRAGAPAGLFVMQRDASADSGESAWSYATVAPSGEVTALGRLETCIRCHRDAPHGGLFGLER